MGCRVTNHHTFINSARYYIRELGFPTTLGDTAAEQTLIDKTASGSQRSCSLFSRTNKSKLNLPEGHPRMSAVGDLIVSIRLPDLA